MELLSVNEVERRTGMSHRRIKELAAEHGIGQLSSSGQYLFQQSDLARLVAHRRRRGNPGKSAA